MEMELDGDQDEQENLTPPDIVETANVSLESLPEKSRRIYEKRYDHFIKWCKSNGTTEYSEDILLTYFLKQAEVYKAPSLWSVFSMLKSTLVAKNNVNIGNFTKVIDFLKRKRVGYQPKKSKILNFEQITQFLNQAPDEQYLMIKVALIFGICGACRRQELYDLKPQDITENDNYLIVKIIDARTRKPRTFSVIDPDSNSHYLALYKKYSALRADKPIGKKRFFLKYREGRCINQVIGINTFGILPKIIATYLNLENPQLYTGHCFRRSSTTLLGNQGVNPVEIKRHGGWESSNVAESYVDDSNSSVEQNKFTNIQQHIQHSVENVMSTLHPSGSELVNIKEEEEEEDEIGDNLCSVLMKQDEEYTDFPENYTDMNDVSQPYLLKKRKISSSVNKESLEEAVNMIKQSFSVTQENDDSTKFGQYIACKLRSYNPRTRAVVQHLICNIIFEADMGKYDNNNYSNNEIDSNEEPNGSSVPPISCEQ